MDQTVWGRLASFFWQDAQRRAIEPALIPLTTFWLARAWGLIMRTSRPRWKMEPFECMLLAFLWCRLHVSSTRGGQPWPAPISLMASCRSSGVKLTFGRDSLTWNRNQQERRRPHPIFITHILIDQRLTGATTLCNGLSAPTSSSSVSYRSRPTTSNQTRHMTRIFIDSFACKQRSRPDSAQFCMQVFVAPEWWKQIYLVFHTLSRIWRLFFFWSAWCKRHFAVTVRRRSFIVNLYNVSAFSFDGHFFSLTNFFPYSRVKINLCQISV